MNFSKLQEGKMHRRDFLKGALASFGIKSHRGHDHPALSLHLQNQELATIKEYRTLGRTGFRVSDLSAGQVFEEGIMRTMLERGVNYIDTSEAYESEFRHETMIGRIIKDFDRKSIFITTKLWPEKRDTRESFLGRARKCLERLKVETLDCLMLHSPNSSAVVKNEHFHAVVNELKAEGRLKHAGVSCHGSMWLNKTSETMEQILGTAIEDGRFDVVLVAYSYLNQDQGRRILKACREKGIGTTLMKTDPTGGGVNLWASLADKTAEEGKELGKWEKDILQFRKENQEKARQFMQAHGCKDFNDARAAAIRFVLDNPDVNTAVLTLRTYEEMERILALSGSKLSVADRRILNAYTELFGRLYCRHACGLCEPACPRKVLVNTIMRYHMYFLSQKQEKYAMKRYAHLPGVKADACGTCDAPCQASCPYGVAIQSMLIRAHNDLTLA